jgi:hypothetical protein
MPEIGTSGSMSGDGKRSVAEWPKLSRPSSTLPSRTSRDVPAMSAMEGLSDVKYSLRVFRMLTRTRRGRIENPALRGNVNCSVSAGRGC